MRPWAFVALVGVGCSGASAPQLTSEVRGGVDASAEAETSAADAGGADVWTAPSDAGREAGKRDVEVRDVAADATAEACVPTTCALLGYNCGPASDGCGSMLDCGTCMFPLSCGPDGFGHNCVVGEAGPCGVANCPFGCCDVYGQCAPGSGDGLCGTGGQVCANCLNFGERCQPSGGGGVCKP